MILGLLDGDGGDEAFRLSFGFGLLGGAGLSGSLCGSQSVSGAGQFFTRSFLGNAAVLASERRFSTTAP